MPFRLCPTSSDSTLKALKKLAYGEEVQAWREGMSLAQELARSVGMAPMDAYNGEPGDSGDGNDGGCGVNDVVDDGCGNSDCTFSFLT